MKAIRIAAALSLTFGAIFSISTPASAHDELVSASPTSGETVQAGEVVVALTFAEPPMTPTDTPTATIEVTGPNGATGTNTGCMTITDGSVISQNLNIQQDGVYTVNWRVVSDDGHPVEGKYDFTVTGGTADNKDGATCVMPMMMASGSMQKDAKSTSASTPTGNVFGISPVAGLITGFVIIAIVSTISVLNVRRRERLATEKKSLDED